MHGHLVLFIKLTGFRTNGCISKCRTSNISSLWDLDKWAYYFYQYLVPTGLKNCV
jgi:hypothetical protein